MQSNSRVHCNIGFAELAINMPDSHVEDTVPVLIDILRDVPYIDFDRCLAWDGKWLVCYLMRLIIHCALDWALPDQLVSSTVTALLRIASLHSEYRQVATAAISQFVGQIVAMLKKGDCRSLCPLGVAG